MLIRLRDVPTRIQRVLVAVVVALAAAMILAPVVLAETEIPVHVFEANGVVMRLMSTPCVDSASSMMVHVGLPKYASRFKALESSWPMQDGSRMDFAGCWAELPGEVVGKDEVVIALVFSDGQAFAIPKSEFLKKRGQGGA